LNRLLKKKAVGYKTEGRIFQYYPLVTETECARAESHSFLRRVYNGTLARMVATFLESKDLSREEIEDLKRILDKERRK
jgi:BlaI family penicillinase repressor